MIFHHLPSSWLTSGINISPLYFLHHHPISSSNLTAEVLWVVDFNYQASLITSRVGQNPDRTVDRNRFVNWNQWKVAGFCLGIKRLMFFYTAKKLRSSSVFLCCFPGQISKQGQISKFKKLKKLFVVKSDKTSEM